MAKLPSGVLIDGVQSAAFHEGHRGVRMLSEGDPVDVFFTPTAAFDLALVLLQPDPSAAGLKEVVGLPIASVSAAQADGRMILNLLGSGGLQVAVVLSPEAERQLRRALAASPTEGPSTSRH